MSLYVNGAWVSNSPDLELQYGTSITATATYDSTYDRGCVRIEAGGGGGGDSITVNASAVSDAEFSNVLPAAPALKSNVSWQVDTAVSPANISANVPHATATVIGMVKLAGHLSGSAAVPEVVGLKETGGPTLLTVAGITDGQFLKRVGTTIVSATPPAQVPTGTGFRHVIDGVEDATAKLVDTADVNADQITYAKIQNITATARLLGRITAGAGDAEELTGTQATTLLDAFTSALKGLAPASGGGTTNFLRADGTWNPAGGGSTPTGTGFRHVTAGVEDAASKLVDTADINADQVTYAKIQNISATARILGRITAAAGDIEELTGTQATTLLDAFTSALKGLVPASGGGTTNFLRADGTFAAPPGGGGGINTLRTTANQTINAGAGVFTDITGLTFPVVSGTDYAFEFYITFQSAATTTGWKAGVNCPAGTLDFWAGSDVIANGAAGVATHTERHNTVRDDMTLLTATITQVVDLNVRIKGRYLCTANGTFAARFANELAANTQIVVQKGSWGWYF